jgi:hypothetical protein
VLASSNFFGNKPIWLHHSTKMKLWKLPKIEGFLLKYGVPSVWPSYLIYKVPCPSVRPSVTELGSVTDGRPGPARQNGIPLMSSSAATRRRSRFCRARDSRSALRACACRGLETQVLRAEYRGPETRAPETQCPFIEVLKLRSWEPNAATRQQQKKGAASVCLSPETQLSRLLIGLAWLLK